MRQRIVCLTLWIVFGWSLTGCQLAVRTPDLSYNSSPDHVILYADVQPFPGAMPKQSTCQYDTIPRLRVWGDGLVFLDLSSIYGNEDDQLHGRISTTSLWSGKLSVAQIQALLTFLQGQGFYNHKWTPCVSCPAGPNPAGTWLSVGSQLKLGEEVYTSGDLQPPLYLDLINMIQPSLTPFTLDSLPDPRFASLNIGTRDCNP